MLLEQSVRSFIDNPYPLWEESVTSAIVGEKWAVLEALDAAARDNYSMVAAFTGDFSARPELTLIAGKLGESSIYLEAPVFDLLDTFYEQHGLVPSTGRELADAPTKIQEALEVVRRIPAMYGCIRQLVRTIQVLHQEDPDMDTSYSHPKIPFSIFTSICTGYRATANLRVAESIIHEAMHLKLTLIEHACALVQPGAGDVFYSPWRNEPRPLQGVLHGLFVFRAIHDFYKVVEHSFMGDEMTIDYLVDRREIISDEISMLRAFPAAPGLTREGKALAVNLLSGQ